MIQTTRAEHPRLMWTPKPGLPRPRRRLPISLPGQPGRDRCQLVFVCSKPPLTAPGGGRGLLPFPARAPAPSSGFALRWLHRALREQGSAGKAALALSLSLSREKGSSGSQSQACSTLCLAGKEVIYKLTHLLERRNTGEGAGTIPVRGIADGEGGGHQEVS